MHSHSDSLSDGSAPENAFAAAQKPPLPRPFFEKEQKNVPDFLDKVEVAEPLGESFSDAEAEVAKLAAFCDETKTALDAEQSDLLAERRSNKAELLKCEEWERRFEQNVLFWIYRGSGSWQFFLLFFRCFGCIFTFTKFWCLFLIFHYLIQLFSKFLRLSSFFLIYFIFSIIYSENDNKVRNLPNAPRISRLFVRMSRRKICGLGQSDS